MNRRLGQLPGGQTECINKLLMSWTMRWYPWHCIYETFENFPQSLSAWYCLPLLDSRYSQ